MFTAQEDLFFSPALYKAEKRWFDAISQVPGSRFTQMLNYD